MQRISPCLWFDDQGERRQSFIPLFLKTQRLETLPAMEKNATRFMEGRREQ